MAQPDQMQQSSSLETFSADHLAAYTGLQRELLARYTRLLMMHRDVVPLLDATDWRVRLINKALYSTYMDCVESGVGEEAQQLRQRSRS